MKISCALALLLIFAVNLPVVQAAGIDGNEVLRSCKVVVELDDDATRKQSPVEAYRLGFCLGLMRGIVDVAGAAGGICTPSEFQYSQIARVVVKELEESPETLHQPGSALMFFAISRAYPCASSSGKGKR